MPDIYEADPDGYNPAVGQLVDAWITDAAQQDGDRTYEVAGIRDMLTDMGFTIDQINEATQIAFDLSRGNDNREGEIA